MPRATDTCILHCMRLQKLLQDTLTGYHLNVIF